MPGPAPITLIDPQGVAREVPAESVAAALDRGWRVQTHADVLQAAGAGARETDYGGVHGAVGAIGAGVARGATLGLSDVAARAIGGDEAAATLSGLRAENPALSTGSEIAGAVAPALFTGGASLPSSLAARAGAAVTEGAGGRLVGRLAGGAVEGAIYGTGSGVSELALSQEPLTLARAASTLSSNALFGAGLGAAAGGAARAAEVGLSRAKGAVDGWLTAQSEGRAMKAVGELEAQAAAEPAAIGRNTDLSTLDTKGLKQAEEGELAAIDAERQPMREGFVNDLEEAHRAREANKEWLSIVADRHAEKYTRENAKVVLNVDRRIRNLLDNRIGLAERPGRAKEWLQQEAQALEGLMAAGRQDLETFTEAARSAPATVRKELLSNELDGYRVGKGAIDPKSPVVDDIVAREVERRFPRAENGGLVVPKELAGFEDNRLGIALARNRDLQQFIDNIERAPKSARLSEIEAAREALRTRTAAPAPTPEPSLGRELLSVAAPFAGPLGALATSGAKALGGLRKVAAAAGERAAEASSRMLDVGAKAAAKAAPYAPVVATKVLEGLSYADRDEPPPPRLRQVEDPQGRLATVYRARTDEIKGQTQVAPDGSYQMRPDARQKLAAKFDGIRHVDPIAADRLETAGARRIEYLASIIPRRPDIGGIPAGPDRWQPSDLAMRSFARSAAAVEDPHGVLERAAAGRVVPEEAAALRAVHPEILADFTGGVVAKLPTLRKTLPYAKRLALSLLTGVPVDAAMTPPVLREIQSLYAAEPGTAGGTQAPRAQPQFGSVKRSDPGTPAQRREGLTQ